LVGVLVMLKTRSRPLPQSKYRMLGQVGQGQFAPVFCGRDRETGQLVALKEIDRRRFPAQQFLHELHLLARLRHPNIVQFQALAYSPKGRYLVTDYCAGGTLRELMESALPLQLGQCLDLVMDLLRGLAYAHGQGVIHCDLKPENILLVPEVRGWTARIADFGVSRWLEERGERGAIALMGAPAYMAPECYYGRYSAAADLYAVGVLLYELIMGQRPFAGVPGELMKAHLNQPLVLPPVIPFPLRSIITTALQKLPQRRFDSAETMLKSVMLAAAILRATEPATLAGGRAAGEGFATGAIAPALTPASRTELFVEAVADRPTTPIEARTLTAIAPAGDWLAIVQPLAAGDSPMARWEILGLPGLVRRHMAQTWVQPEHLFVLDRRYGLAILPDRAVGYRTWRWFNRRGGFVDYGRMPATTDLLVGSGQRADQVLTIEAGDPTMALLVDLKPLRVRRVALGFVPDALVAVAAGYSVVGRSGRSVMVDAAGNCTVQG
jgi:eukaryotic-like serine/threonine-protein kinase